MTIPKVKCKKCGYEGDYNSEVIDGLCQDCGETAVKKDIELPKIEDIERTLRDIKRKEIEEYKIYIFHLKTVIRYLKMELDKRATIKAVPDNNQQMNIEIKNATTKNLILCMGEVGEPEPLHTITLQSGQECKALNCSKIVINENINW